MRILAIICLFLLHMGNIFGQAQDLDKLYNKARNKYATAHFEEARDLYKKLITAKPKDFVFNYELGLLYFYELNDKSKSIAYFETAKEVMKDTVADLYNYLGQAYQQDLQYEKAIEAYNKYSSIPPKEGVIRVSVKRYINECREEKKRLAEIEDKRNSTTQSGIQVINLGPVVNSENNDYSPLRYKNQLVFSSEREFDYVFNEYILQSYKTTFTNEKYQKPELLSEISYDKGLVVDPSWHQQISSVTMDGDMATVIYEQDIWIIEKKGKNWSEPDELSRKINRTRNNAYAALSGKGNRMIIALFDKKTKQFDLFQTTKDAEGEWKDPVKLNDNINTGNNENYPYLSADGYTLYFSSDRAGGKGKYDIYASQLEENNEWGVPKLLDAPINSNANDIMFKKYESINKAYFSSDRKGGFGKHDIYEVIY